jgi:hypothetical protein
LPDDAELVVVVNVRQALGSEPVRGDRAALGQIKALLDRFAGGHPALERLRRAGADVSRDLSRITFAGPRGKGLAEGLLVLEGDWEAGRLRAALAGMLKVPGPADTALYEIAAPRGGRYHAALVNAATLVVGRGRTAVTDALARASGRNKSGLRKELAVLLASATGQESVRFAATGPALSQLLEGASVPNAAAAVAALKSLDGFSGSFTLATPVRFQLAVYARDGETAKKLAEAAGSAAVNLRAVVEQNARKDGKLLPLMEVARTLRATAAGPTVLLQCEVGLEDIEKLVKSVPAGPPGAGR